MPDPIPSEFTQVYERPTVDNLEAGDFAVLLNRLGRVLDLYECQLKGVSAWSAAQVTAYETGRAPESIEIDC